MSTKWGSHHSEDFFVMYINYLDYLDNKEKQDDKNYLTIIAFLAYKYYEANGTFEELITFLKYREVEEKIISWARDKYRFKAYNYLLKMVSETFEENDPFFYKHLEIFVKKMTNRSISAILNKLDFESNTKICAINIQRVEELFISFLKSINAPYNWFLVFDELKKENILIYEDFAKKTGSKCYFDDQNVLRILICEKDDINAACTLMHEFIHYLYLRKTDRVNANLSLLEFPNIYFEKLMADYLEKQGLISSADKLEIVDREKHDLKIFLGLSDVFSDLIQYKNEGKVTKEKKLLDLRKMKSLTNYLEISEKTVDEKCDSNIKLCITKPSIVINGYKYIMGSILADALLQNEENVKDMIYVSEALDSVTLENVIDIFGLYHLFNLTKDEKVKFSN